MPVFRSGERVYETPSADEARARAKSQLRGFHPGIRRLVNPHSYPVGLEPGLHALKTALVLEARGIEV